MREDIWILDTSSELDALPLTLREIQQGIANNTIPRSARMRRRDSEDWRPVTDALLTARASPRPPALPAVRRKRRLAGATVVASVLAIAAVGIHLRSRGDNDRRRAIVRVHAGSASGTGFSVRGPDEWAYIATAFHVVDCGCPVLVARSTEVGDDKFYVQAFPETALVAFNTDDDLAILRVRNVKASEFGVLDLAAKPVKDEPITSHGFPGATLMHSHGMLSQDGKILGVGKFDVMDSRTRLVVRQNAVDGILVSSALEPGYSGGPTLNAQDEVVGVNAIKDRTRTSHNGAVSVEALRKLLDTVQPAAVQPDPTVAEVEELLRRVSGEYLTLPVDARFTRSELPHLALSDRPALAQLTTEVRRLYADLRVPRTSKEASLSPRATLGVVVGSQPGSALGTFRAESLQAVLAECDKRRAAQPFGSTDTDAACSAGAERALAWDLAQLSLGVADDPRGLSVTSIERVDAAVPNYRVAVTAKGAQSSFDLWVRREATGLRLKLFDDQGRPYGLTTRRPIAPGTIAGTWIRSNAATPLPNETTQELRETLTITAQADGYMAARHVVEARLRPKRNLLFRCGGGMNHVDGTIEQDFAGKLDASAGVLRRVSEATSGSAFACKVGVAYSLDAAMVVRLRGDRLVVLRTDGAEFPEEVEFVRQTGG